MTHEHKHDSGCNDHKKVSIDVVYKYSISTLFDITRGSKAARHYYLTNTKHYHSVKITQIEPSLLSDQRHIENFFLKLAPRFTKLFHVTNFATFTFDASHLQLFLHFKGGFKQHIDSFISTCTRNATNPNYNIHHEHFTPKIERYLPRPRVIVKFGVLLRNVDDFQDGEEFVAKKLRETFGLPIKSSQLVRFPPTNKQYESGDTVLIKFTDAKSKKVFIQRFLELNDKLKGHAFIINDRKTTIKDYTQQHRVKEFFMCGKCVVSPFHISKNCFKKKYSCGICPGSHPTNSCPDRYNTWCRHCKSTDHSTISASCPYIQRYLSKGYKYVVKDEILKESNKFAHGQQVYLKPNLKPININSSFNHVARRSNQQPPQRSKPYKKHNQLKPSKRIQPSFSFKQSNSQRKKQNNQVRRRNSSRNSVKQLKSTQNNISTKAKPKPNLKPKRVLKVETDMSDIFLSSNESTPSIRGYKNMNSSPQNSVPLNPRYSPTPPVQLHQSFGDNAYKHKSSMTGSILSSMSSILPGTKDIINFYNVNFLPPHLRDHYDG